MTLKFPGATSDLIATKNLFDVYLKSRVLDICGDVRDKENIKKWYFKHLSIANRLNQNIWVGQIGLDYVYWDKIKR